MVGFDFDNFGVMRKILIIYPHWPPSNLVGVHRVRLIANELHDLGWQAIVLTVDHRDYEEECDESGLMLISPNVNVIKVRARRVVELFGKRIIGDIGLRAYFQLRDKALELCGKQTIDFAWISVPSWYPSLIGRLLYRIGIPFGIDYQDPWVYDLPDGTKPWSREAWTIRIAKFLEPIAVNKASAITGINQAYFQGVLARNPHLRNVELGAFQLGYSASDHRIELPGLPSPWKPEVRVFIYAGAFLPMSMPLWHRLFEALAVLNSRGELDQNVRLYLFGTKQHYHQSLHELASNLGIGKFIVEHPERIPFLHVQEYLRRAEGILSIGSTEMHYSASKTFQCLLSNKKIFGYFHALSEAREILEACEAADYFVPFAESDSAEDQRESLATCLLRFIDAEAASWRPNLKPMDKYSSRRSAEALIETVERVLDRPYCN